MDLLGSFCNAVDWQAARFHEDCSAITLARDKAVVRELLKMLYMLLGIILDVVV